MELVVEAHHPPVDLGPHHGVADGGVDGVGEVDRGGPGGQVHHVPPGGKDKDLVGEEVHLQRVDELLGVGVLLIFQQAANPFVGPFAALLLDALLVLPVGGHTVLVDSVHVVGADLHLEGDALLTDDGGVEGLVHVGLGGGDIVLKAAQDGLIDVVDNPQHVVAVRHRVHQCPEGEEVVKLLHGLLLEVHLPVDAVGVLHPAVDGGVGDILLRQTGADLLLNPAHKLVVLDAVGGQLLRDLAVGHRVQVLQGQILQLPLDLRQAQTVGDGGVDLHGFKGLLLLLGRGLVLHGAHVVEPVGDLDEDHADIPTHGEEHLPEVLHLLLFHGGVLHPRQLGDPVHDVRHRHAEALGDVLVSTVGVLHAVVKEGGDDGLAVQAHLRHNLGHIDGMGNKGRPVTAHLLAVVLPGVFIGSADLVQVRGDIVPPDGLFQMLIPLFYCDHRSLSSLLAQCFREDLPQRVNRDRLLEIDLQHPLRRDLISCELFPA